MTGVRKAGVATAIILVSQEDVPPTNAAERRQKDISQNGNIQRLFMEEIGVIIELVYVILFLIIVLFVLEIVCRFLEHRAKMKAYQKGDFHHDKN